MSEIAVKKEIYTLLSHREGKELINTGEPMDKDRGQTLIILWTPRDHLQFILENVFGTEAFPASSLSLKMCFLLTQWTT